MSLRTSLANASGLLQAITLLTRAMAIYIADALLAARQAIAPTEVNKVIAPLGFWRCTYAAPVFGTSFVAGCIYEARSQFEGSSSIRLIPSGFTTWAPYWVPSENRFNYRREILDFEYIGANVPSRETSQSTALVRG